MKEEKTIEIGVIWSGVSLTDELNEQINNPEHEFELSLSQRQELAKLLKHKYMDHYQRLENRWNDEKGFVFLEKSAQKWERDKNIICQIVKVNVDKPFYIDNYDCMGEEVWQFQNNESNFLSHAKRIDFEEF